jgi:hypothetical protein
VIKIRYSDLPGGVHVSADVRGKHTILFLLPGLTAAQRNAAIRRARSAARVGHGPVLPALGLARALAADRIATTVRNGLAAMRMHPVIFIPPMIIALCVAIAYVLLVAVSFRFGPPSQATGQVPVVGGSAVHRSGAAGPGSGPARGLAPGSRPSRPPAAPGQPGSPSPGSSPSPSPARPSPHLPASPSPSAPDPSPFPAAPSPAPSTSPAPGSGSGSGSGGTGGCVEVSLIGVCVAL